MSVQTYPASSPALGPTPSPDTQAMLDSLQQAVTKTLERKRRLGQYVVQWSGKAPVAVGADAPPAILPTHD